MSSPLFTSADLAQLEARGVTLEEAEAQIASLASPPPAIVLDRPCAIGDGIAAIETAERAGLIDRGDSAAAAGRVSKFVPASGAATRMFRDLISALNDARRPTASPAAREFFEQLDDFPFAEELRRRARLTGTPATEAAERGVLETLLNGMSYAHLPKALIPFHRVDRPRTAFEEQLLEGARYVRSEDGVCRMHFTVAPEFHEAFAAALQAVVPAFSARRRGATLEVTFSEQDPSTDTLALDADGRPFRLADGTLLFRPGGHGSLISNLNAFRGDIVVIKNVDNVLPDETTSEVVRWKRMLIGYLAQIQAEVFELLAACAQPDAPEPVLDRAIALAAFRFARRPPGPLDGIEAKRRFVFTALDRPLRVCGVVRNEGEPGGAPFWTVEPDGTMSVQIVESSQADSTDPRQLRIFRSATHFNPVDLVCGVRSWNGELFDLTRFVDPGTVFMSSKTHEGRPLTALERPGLWNGAMARWNTICVEVPASTFAPVKTVFDLLRPQHQYRAVAAPASRGPGPDITGCVLLIEDHPAHQRALEQILTAAGIEVTIAAEGERGVETAAAGGIDLVLLDTVLPGLDGYEVLARLRDDAATARIPVIFVSSAGEAADRVRGLELGAADYIAEPFPPQEVLARVRAQLRIGQLAASLHRAKTQLVEKQEVLAEDLRAAAEIQRTLLPPPAFEMPGLTVGAGFQPSIQVGGDMFNVLPVGDGLVAAYVVDVSGHGVASALLTISVTQRLSAAFGLLQQSSDSGPAALLRQLDAEFPFERFGKYFSLAIAVIETASGRFRYCSAGHPPPFIARAAGGVEVLRAGGPVIGLGFGLPFDEAEGTLSTGDRLVLYTDGVTDDENMTGERFGVGALQAFFAARRVEGIADTCDALMRLLGERRGDVPPSDDIALVALERR